MLFEHATDQRRPLVRGDEVLLVWIHPHHDNHLTVSDSIQWLERRTRDFLVRKIQELYVLIQ